MKKKAYFATAEELERLGPEAIPPQMISGKHLIYSSPATLAFNSPGAEGFGVKRAGLAVPDSIMLIVAPGCCGRNTSLISSMPEYNDRFFYLMMDETDIVTGRHLKKIPKAVKEICDCCEKKPSVVMRAGSRPWSMCASPYILFWNHRRKKEMWSISWDFFRRWWMTVSFMICYIRLV